MALVSPYDTALIHEFGRRETVRLLAERRSAKRAPVTLRGGLWPPATFFTSLRSDNGVSVDDQIPSIEACAVHLELLETFMVLRRKVLLSNALVATFGQGQSSTAVISGEDVEKKRGEKWEKFVHLAVARFKIWLKYIQDDDERQRTIYDDFRSELPPIDVLMVLHAFMLNPKEYREYFSTPAWTSSNSMLNLRFPWKAIHETLDVRTGAYQTPTTPTSSFKDILHPDLLKFLASPSLIDKETLNALSDTPRANTAEISEKHARNLLDHYKGELSETPADLTFDLAAAVHRQSKFIDKMCHMLWLRSPALTHTLEGAQTRYKNFFALFKRYPGKLIVPTLDVDLVWHTHQLHPSAYHFFCITQTGRFINHDDKIGKGKLDDSFGEVKGLYYREFATAYQICLCWDCEALREAVDMAPLPKVESEMVRFLERVRKRVAGCRADEIARRVGVQKRAGSGGGWVSTVGPRGGPRGYPEPPTLLRKGVRYP